MAEQVFQRERVKRFDLNLQKLAQRKLEILNAAAGLVDLKSPPGNKLEKLSGRRKGQFSIRVNDQWRICFKWHDGDAHNVEIVDYH